MNKTKPNLPEWVRGSKANKEDDLSNTLYNSTFAVERSFPETEEHSPLARWRLHNKLRIKDTVGGANNNA